MSVIVTPVSALADTLSQDASYRLRSLLEHIRVGQPLDYRSPFMNAEPRETIISKWADRLYPTPYPWLTTLEEQEQEKIGPFSIQLPFSERTDHLREYFDQLPFEGDPFLLGEAYKRVLALYPRKLRPINLETAFESVPQNTNWGLPNLSRQKEEHFAYLLRAREAEAANYAGGVSRWVYPAIIWWRGQAQGIDQDPKQRDVWGMDHMPVIVAKSVIDPILVSLRQWYGFSAWSSLDSVDRAVTRMLDAQLPIISLDYKSFDQSVNSVLIGKVYDAFRHAYRGALDNRLHFLEDTFKHVGCVTPYGVWSGRDGGVPSGAEETGMMDTTVNYLAAIYTSLRLNTHLVAFEGMGDDGLCQFNPPVKVEDMVEAVAELGLRMSPEKTSISTEQVHFLQRVHHTSYRIDGLARGVRSTMRTLGSMISFERMKPGWSTEFNTLRWLMQIEQTKWHPLFHEFVEFYTQGDKYALSSDPVQTLKAVGGWRGAEGVLGVTSFPWRIESLGGLGNFATVRELRQINSRRKGS